MNDEEFSRIRCNLCGKPLSLTSDTVADEDGKPVHESCYVRRTLPSKASQGQEEAP
jgi:hypothetical protein